MTDEERRQFHIKNSLAHSGMTCFTYPHEWKDTHYAFFMKHIGDYSHFFCPEDAIYIAIGDVEAFAWLKGYLQRMEETEDV